MTVEFDVYEYNPKSGISEKVGVKEFRQPTSRLSKWVDRPKGTVTKPPIGNALDLKVTKNNVSCDKLAPDALGYLRADSNGIFNQALTVLTTLPCHAGHGWSVTSENFERSLLVMAIRLLPKKTWLNNRDQYEVPNVDHPGFAQFAQDSIIWALFHGKNCTSSLSPVQYKGARHEINNEFFWVYPDAFESTRNKPQPIIQQLRQRPKERFVSSWLTQGHSRNKFSPDTMKLVAKATDLVLTTVPMRGRAAAHWQLDQWDAGWYQLRMWIKKSTGDHLAEARKQLEEITALHKKVGDRLRSVVYELGCLPEEKLFE